MTKPQTGFTLVELVIFIVIVGLVIAAVFVPLQTVLENSPDSNYQTIATALAQERMEIILGKRYMLGLGNTTTAPPSPLLVSPCGAAAICVAAPTGYTISSNITAATVRLDNDYEQIVVTVTGPSNSQAVLTALVGNY